MSENSVVQFGDTTIQYQVRRSVRRKKTCANHSRRWWRAGRRANGNTGERLTGNRKEAGSLDSEPCLRGYA